MIFRLAEKLILQAELSITMKKKKKQRFSSSLKTLIPRNPLAEIMGRLGGFQKRYTDFALAAYTQQRVVLQHDALSVGEYCSFGPKRGRQSGFQQEVPTSPGRCSCYFF